MEIDKLNRTLIFTHIPKTAGITFRSILYNNYPRERINYLYQTEWNKIPERVRQFEKDVGCQVITGHYPFGLHESIQSDYTYVLFLRNPRRHVLSHYNHLLNSSDPIHKEKIKSWESFEEFVRSDWGIDVQVQYISGLSPDEIRESPERALEQAKANLTGDKVLFGITERFDESLLLFREALGWEHIHYIKRNVGSSHPGSKGVLTPGMEEYIANSLDQKLYTFAAEHFESRLSSISGMRFKRMQFGLGQLRYRLATKIKGR